MPHMQKFAYILHMRSHFSALALSNVVLKPLNILAANNYRYLQLKVKKLKMLKLCRKCP